MPVIFEKQIDTAKKLAVWHITESEDKIYEIGSYLPDILYSKKRNRELAVSRILLNYLLGYDAHLNLIKDKFGKPFLDNSKVSVSFSHSQDMVACIINTDGESVGIDIEKKRERIKLLADKFCTENDQSGQEEGLHYHLVWGGKEVLYKIYAKKELDFRQNLTIKLEEKQGFGEVNKNGNSTRHTIEWDDIEGYVLAWGY